MNFQKLIDEFVSTCKNILEEKLVGVYLHGSLAMGCFNPEKSDIDLLVVIKDDISDEQKMQFMKHVVRLNELAPKKGLELSVLKAENCKPFTYPTPFELHFSPMHLSWFHDNPEDYVKRMNGVDKDLAAHVMITNQYGITLSGMPIVEVFGEVSREDYVDSILEDIGQAQEDILEDGVYFTLNLCRVLAFLKDNQCLSKETGGEWGLKSLPVSYHSLLTQALDCYKTNQNFEIEDGLLIHYATYMLGEINSFL